MTENVTHVRHMGLHGGFGALVAVILLATCTLSFSLAAMSAAAAYADMTFRREMRIQAGLNVESCLDSVFLMTEKDYFLNGRIILKEFGCEANVANDFNGKISVSAHAALEGISVWDNR